MTNDGACDHIFMLDVGDSKVCLECKTVFPPPSPVTETAPVAAVTATEPVARVAFGKWKREKGADILYAVEYVDATDPVAKELDFLHDKYKYRRLADDVNGWLASKQEEYAPLMGGKKPSVYQVIFFDFLRYRDGHAVLRAVAGSGKTSSVLAGFALMPETASGAYFAFSKRVAEEVQHRLPNRVAASTIHAFGNKIVRAELKKRGVVPRLESNKEKKLVRELLAEALPFPPNSEEEEEYQERFTDSLKELVSMVRVTLVDYKNANALAVMARLYELTFEPSVIPYLAKFIERSNKQALEQGIIDFTDMLWLPVHYNWRAVETFNWVMIDEAQDLSACQLMLALKSCRQGGRMIFVGDPRQAIFLFAGAASDSIDRIIKLMNAEILELSVCYRCPDSHLKLARHIVSYIQTAPLAAAGSIEEYHIENMMNRTRPGDLLICRKKAPLVKWAFAYLKAGIPAYIAGSDILDGLQAIIKRLEKKQHATYANFLEALEVWELKEVAFLTKQDADEERIEQVHDKAECLRIAYGHTKEESIAGIVEALRSLFEVPQSQAVTLSSVHRAKGLEANRVGIIEPELMPLFWKGISDEQRLQELNILYVALTRAKQALLLFVRDSTSWRDRRYRGLTTPLPAELAGK